MDWKLELVIVPVSDVDRAKAFYTEKVGFNLDVDHRAGDEFRVVQMTPPGSACSITIGNGMEVGPPGSLHGLHLVVSDIDVAWCRARRRAGSTSARSTTSGRTDRCQGPIPNGATTNPSPPSRTLTATRGCCRR